MDTEHIAITEPVRRLEVFTGAGRRRTWRGQGKALIVAEMVPATTPSRDLSHCPNRSLTCRRRHARTAYSSYRRDLPAQYELERRRSRMHPSPSMDRGRVPVRDLAPENILNSSDSVSEYTYSTPSR